MHSIIKFNDLRTSDNTLLEVMLGDALTRPFAQIDLSTVVDMIAISEADGLSSRLQDDLSTFVQRMAGSVRDLPEGKKIRSFCDTLGTLDAEKIPAALRAIVVEEAKRTDRKDADRAMLSELFQAWEAVAPETIVLGAKKARVVHGAEPEFKSERFANKRSEVPVPKTAKAKRTKSTRTKVDKPEKLEIPGATDEEIKAISDTVFDRLSDKSNGLVESVLVAGVQHRVRATFSTISPPRIMTVLKALEKEGKIKKSSNRWFFLSRW